MNVFLVDSRTAGVLALVFTLFSASSNDPIALRWSSTANMISYKLPPHPLRNDAANSNGYAAKKKPTALKLY